MKKLVIKDGTKSVLRNFGGMAVIITALLFGYFIGLKNPSKEKKEVVTYNPYEHAFAPGEISIAVNESNELIVIERNTGDYIVYSDTIGMTIFEMYSNRIYKKAVSGE